MNGRHVQFAVTTAAERSFSAAALRCHVSQPTLSNGIAVLEKQLGGALFLRTTRKVELSPFGRHMLPMLEALEQSRREIKSAARKYYEPTHQLIRIGLSPLVDMKRIKSLLEPFRAEFPKCEIFFKECFVPDMDGHLDKAQLDIVIRPRQPAKANSRSLHTHELYREPVFYLPPHAGEPESAGRQAATVAEIADGEFLLGPEGCGLAAFTRTLFKRAGKQLIEYRGQALSYQLMQDWADCGIGATILPGSKLMPQYRARARPLSQRRGAPVQVSFDAVWPLNSTYPRHVSRLHQLLQVSSRATPKRRVR